MSIKEKTIGFYFIVLAEILGIVSIIRFSVWGSTHDSFDWMIVIALALGIILDTILLFKDNEFMVVMATICYSVPAVKVVTNSVGSFVDAFQGINMFGDASQVGKIVSLMVMMMISVLASVIASFLKRVK